jgi:hypothetical protein
MRQEVWQRTPEHFDAMSKILLEQDIVAITLGGEDDNTDEYDLEADTVTTSHLDKFAGMRIKRASPRLDLQCFCSVVWYAYCFRTHR